MNIYKQAFSLGLQTEMRYRADFFLGMIGMLFPLCIQYFLWTSIFNSGSGTVHFGYTLPGMLSYAAFAVMTSHIVASGFVYGVNNEIKSGGMAKYLVRPMRYMPYEISCFLGGRCVSLVLSSILIISTSIIFNTIWHNTVSFQNVLLYFLIITLSIVLNFVIYFAIAGVGFWMRDASGAIFIITVVGNIISGGIFPLDIFSGNIQFILKLFPFAYTNYFPVSVLCGRTVGSDIYRGVILQLGWILILLFLQQMVWKRGLKRYTAVGG